MFDFCNVIAGTTRSFGDLDDEEDDIFGSKKVFYLVVCFLVVIHPHVDD